MQAWDALQAMNTFYYHIYIYSLSYNHIIHISYIYIYTYIHIHIFTFLADLNNLLGLHRGLSTPLWFLGDSWCAVRFAQVVYLDEDVLVKGDLLELFHVSMSRSIGGLVMFIGSLTSMYCIIVHIYNVIGSHTIQYIQYIIHTIHNTYNT